MSKRKATQKRVYASRASAPFSGYLAEQMKDADFAREYEALEPEFDIIRQVIALRIKRNLTQKQLAEKVGTQQPSIARLERKGKTTDLGFLRRVAEALDARVEVHLVPREAASGKRQRSKRT